MPQTLEDLVNSLSTKKKMKAAMQAVVDNKDNLPANVDPKAIKTTRELINKMTDKKKKEDRIELKRKTEPFWKLYLSFWYSAIKNNSTLIEKEINNLFDSKLNKNEINQTIERIDEIIGNISNTKTKISKEDIKEIIETKTLIYEQFTNKFINRISHDMYKLKFPGTIVESEIEKIKINEKNIDEKIEFTKKLFIEEIIKLYLQSKQ